MLAMMAVFVDYTFKMMMMMMMMYIIRLKCVFNFLYSTSGPPNVTGPGVTYTPYSLSRRAWVR